MVPDVALALQLLNQLISWIASLRASQGLGDDALAAQVKTVTAGNDDAYNALMTALNLPKPPNPTAVKP
jgi:hypothetical protein